MSQVLASVLEVVNNAYENGELQIGVGKEFLGHGRGDLLAEFLHTEIMEVAQGEDESVIPQLALKSVCTAIKQLEAVKLAIEPLVNGVNEDTGAPEGTLILNVTRRVTAIANEELVYHVQEVGYRAAVEEEGSSQLAFEAIRNDLGTQCIEYSTNIVDITQEHEISIAEG